MFGSDIGIDLGTSSVLIYIKGQGIVLKEPSVVAIDRRNNEVIAVGEKAKQMIGKAPANVNVIRPLREGVISDYNVTEIMLRYFIKKVIGKTSRLPRIAVCVPSEVTEVEKKAVKDATKEAGAREVFVIEEPIAAAIGSGIDITRACGSMIVDIGGGTTDIAVISLGGAVVKSSLKIAGDNFDEAIIRHIRKKYNVLIGEKSAEELKVNVGTVYKRSAPVNMDIRGRNLVTGLPNTINVTSEELYEALKEPVDTIIDTIHKVLEKTPPELASDIYERGIVMTGGGALIYGLDKAIKEATGINAVLAEDALSCVALGTGQYIEYNNKFESARNSFFKKILQLFKWR
ncbi:rod shape-determining protein [[Clostridium] colinum]|uniref:rod shape-determining protein n=1 Tax=[Clostridium] colinum TaxID=36835 RepID=UPI00202511A8|nr:rod shape-determining protein MreB [[Clostridium] colinum]